MSVTLDRRSLLKLTGGAALAATIPAMSAGSAAAATGATLLGTAPDAADARIVAKSGQNITTLFPHQGKVYYGYGNYSTNSGSGSGLGTNVSYYDPATGQFVVALAGFNTEEVMVYRELSGNLYAPSIDPCGGSASFASNRGGQWYAAAGIPNGIHIYDVAEGASGELFACGSAGGGGGTLSVPTVWRSTDGGASWSVFFEEPSEADDHRDGYERFYWMGRLGDKLYIRVDNGTLSWTVTPLRVFDLTQRTWSTVPNISEAFIYARSGRDVVSNGSELFSNGFGRVYAFNGKSVRLVGSSFDYMGTTDKGEVLLSSSVGMQLVQGTSLVSLATDMVGPATLIGDQLYFAEGSDLYVRTVSRPGTSGGTGTTGSKRNKRNKRNKRRGDTGGGGTLI